MNSVSKIENLLSGDTKSIMWKYFHILILLFYSGCVNPFAPSLDEELNNNESLISDLTNVEGVFRNLQYAYTFQDTTIYGDLISNDFTFTYRDYDAGFDKSWGRDDEMFATYSMFQNTQRLDLIWNNILLISEDSTTIVRSFNLTVTLNPTDIIRVDGKVNLTLEKTNGKWEISRWIDESNF